MSSEDATAQNDTSSVLTWTAERLESASYKDLGSPACVEDRFYHHLLSSPTCIEEIQVLLRTESSSTTRDYSIPIDSFDLLNADAVLGHMLVRFPATLLPLLENAVVRAQREILQQAQAQQQAQLDSNDTTTSPPPVLTMTVKGGCSSSASTTTTRIHARLIHLPPHCFQHSIGAMQAHDVGKIVQVTGTVVRTSPIQMYESARTYKCCSSSGGSGGAGKKKGAAAAAAAGCGRTFVVHADMECRDNNLQPPQSCPHCHSAGVKVVSDSHASVHTDYQEVKIQEAASRIGIGHIPRSLLVKLQHDLVDTCQPGDEVVIVGSLLAQWQHPSQGADAADCQIGMAMAAHSVRVVAEKGSSAWKSATTTSSSSSNSNNNNSVGELDKFRKEFEAYWEAPENQQNPILARDFICKSVCPKLYGLAVIKLALLVTLIGGVSADAYVEQRRQASCYDDDNNNDDDNGGGRGATQQNANDKEEEDDYYNHNEPRAFYVDEHHNNHNSSQSDSAAAYYGDATSNSQRRRRQQQSQDQQQQQVQTRRRDQSHLLLVGDPGTGKSQILRFAAALCPRSVLTTGVGTTSAGLTCAAVREGSGKEFALEAGALVLADKGVCCIDEFGCIRPADRTTIHEAMEQQTLSVAKAGIVCKLNCRATIIAVMNPRDCLYDNHASLSTNTGLGTPLLSRFDLIFKLVDASDAERDSKVTTYLLERAIQGAGFDVDNHHGGGDEQSREDEPWTMEKLRAYIAIVKERFQPAMSDEAALLLERHYEKCRSAQSNTIPITVRFLESIIRLSQAHARLMFRNTVTLEDAVAVIRLMECSAFVYGGFDGRGVDDPNNLLYVDPMTVDFSNEAETDFCCFAYNILNRYGMLEYLDQDRCRVALEALGRASAGVNGAAVNNDWQDWENHANNRNHAPVRPNNNNNTGYLSYPEANGYGGGVDASQNQHWPWSSEKGQQQSSDDHRNNIAGFPGPAQQQQQQPQVSQDHYGRLHFTSSTQSTSPHPKRPRH